MIWRKQYLLELGGFDVELGMTGDSLGLGEDTDIFRRAWLKHENAVFYYSPDLVVRHWVPANKMSVKYQLLRQLVGGQLKANLRNSRSIYSISTYVLHTGILLLRATVRALINIPKHKNINNWLIEECARPTRHLGEIFGAVRFKFIPRR